MGNGLLGLIITLKICQIISGIRLKVNYIQNTKKGTYIFQTFLTLLSRESITNLTLSNVSFDWKFGLVKNYKTV